VSGDEIAYGDPDRRPSSRGRWLVALVAVGLLAALPASRVLRDTLRSAVPRVSGTTPAPALPAPTVSTRQPVSTTPGEPVATPSVAPRTLPTDLSGRPIHGRRGTRLLLINDPRPQLLWADTGEVVSITGARRSAPGTAPISGWTGLRSGSTVFVHRQPGTIGDEQPAIGELYVLQGTRLRFLRHATEIAPSAVPGHVIAVTRDPSRAGASFVEVDGGGSVTRDMRSLPVEHYVIRGMANGLLLTRIEEGEQPGTVLWDPRARRVHTRFASDFGTDATPNVAVGMDCDADRCRATVTSLTGRRSQARWPLPRGRLHFSRTISPDGRWLAAVATETREGVSVGERITVLDLRNGRAIDVQGTHVDADVVLSLDWSPDSRRLYVATSRRVGVWSPGDSEIAVLKGNLRGVLGIVCVSGC